MVVANITHLPVRFGRNQLVVNVDAADESIVDRSGLSYHAQVLVPKAYQSGEFVELVHLSGSEVPPRNDAGLVVYDGWAAEIGEFLDGLLEWQLPKAGQTEMSVQAGAVLPYRVRTWVENNEVAIDGTDVTSGVEYVIKGRLNENQFPAWGDLFFSKYLDTNKMFLTWQPDMGFVDKDMPVYLSFLVNFTPKPEKIKLWCTVLFLNGSTESFMVNELGVSQYSLLTIPVGFGALGLADREVSSTVFKYKVWLSNEADEVVSEERNYVINKKYFEHSRYLIFVNSLSGIDVMRCTGVLKKTLKLNTSMAERALAVNYLPESEEVFMMNVKGQRLMTISTGVVVNYKWLEWFEELAWSSKVSVVTKEGYIPIVRTDDSFLIRDEKEYLGGRFFSFFESKEGVGYSNMPVGSLPAARATAWVPTQEYCLVNENGVRTGAKGYQKLKLVYVDNGERVKGVAMKANVPGTDGYYGTEASGDCAATTTPFRNVSLARNGTYRKNDCGFGYAGTIATIEIAANVYGSDVSQIDADGKALAAALALDTQVFGNLNGSCVAMVAGLRGKYYDYSAENSLVPTLSTWMNTATVALNRIDESISFSGNWAFGGALSEDYFCVRWTGYLIAPVSGLVRFRVISDDGVRLWVNGVLVIDSWEGHVFNDPADGSIVLENGKIYNFRLEYYEYAGANNIELRWLYGAVNAVVPATAFLTEP